MSRKLPPRFDPRLEFEDLDPGPLWSVWHQVQNKVACEGSLETKYAVFRLPEEVPVVVEVQVVLPQLGRQGQISLHRRIAKTVTRWVFEREFVLLEVLLRQEGEVLCL